jgi:LEA14-like dessication related protein
MKKGLIIFFIVVFVIVSCTAILFFIYRKRSLKIIFPTVKRIEKILVLFRGDTALVDADLKLRNESFLKLNIDSLIYETRLDTMTVLHKAQKINLKLKPGEESRMKLPLAFNFRGLANNIRRLQAQDSVGILLHGRVVYSTIFGRLSLPIKKEIIIEVPIPPKLEVEKLEYNNREKKVFHFNARINLINEGKLDLRLSAIHYTLVVKDNFTAMGHDDKEIHLSAHSKQLVNLPVNAQFEHPLKTGLKILTDNDQVNYDLKIKALIGMDKINQKKTEIEIKKSGVMELKK